ncbi:HNH endonuclease [Achromobacter pestifer]|uniref:HNH endonuclease n=1 Tax=Achromobacter pestifer TaxID=1353889 RepID=UPI001581F6FE|nr:HNH endonuclease [Achromobacter pestifer]
MAERILANTMISDELTHNGTPCWLWIGARNASGYGKMSMRFKKGPRKGKVKSALAHRVALVEMGGCRLNSKSVVMHLCNNRLCCNPAHLKGGTQRKNVQQCVAEGRHFTPFKKAA